MVSILAEGITVELP